MHIADAQQVHLVGLRGLSADGVTEEKQHVHFVAGDAGNDLLVTAVAARQKALYVQAGGFGHKPPRGTRGDQPVLAQNLPIGNAELNHQFFLCIMCNKGNRHKKSPTFYKLQHSMAMRFLSKKKVWKRN